MLLTTTYSTGNERRFRNVDATMPPTTAVPTEVPRLLAGAAGDHQRHDAEDERERGHQNRPQADARRFDAGVAIVIPRARSCSANSTTRMPFFADSRSASPVRSGSRRR
jgi:hypothetical protein